MFTLELQQFAMWLYGLGAFKNRWQNPDHRGFTLKQHEKNPSAPLSPIYLNLRTAENPKPGPLTKHFVRAAGHHLYALAVRNKLRFTHVAGIPYAGTPFAHAFCKAAPEWKTITLLTLEKAAESSGRRIGGIVHGRFKRGDRVLLVDDVVTKGGSKREAITALEAAGLVVRDILVLVDRQEGGAAELAGGDYHLHSLISIRDLLDLYLTHNKLEVDQYEEINEYVRNSSSG